MLVMAEVYLLLFFLQKSFLSFFLMKMCGAMLCREENELRVNNVKFTELMLIQMY